jgi:multidrug efflux pump
MGFSASDIYTAIELMLAPVYVNDFFYQGRILRVVVQADAPFRMNADALRDIYLPSTLPAGRATVSVGATALGTVPMVPLSSVVRPSWTMGSPSLVRFNGYSAIEIQGQPAPGRSSGEAMTAMKNIIERDLPKGFSFDWAGQSLQEIVSGNQAPMLFTLSILVVFLCLAALYESWTIPIAVLLIVPLGVLGAVVAADVRGLPDDVYFKIGLITIIGLAAKNAILIVEFAVELQRQGKSLRAAVVEAGRLRMRPILMTSFAFILGVIPLAFAAGAGAELRQALGVAVFFGMIGVTVFGLIFTPVFYVVTRSLSDRLPQPPGKRRPAAAAAEGEP